MNKKKQIQLEYNIENISIKTQKTSDTIDRYKQDKIELKSKIIELLESEANPKSIKKSVLKLEKKNEKLKKTQKSLNKSVSKLSKLQSKLPDLAEATPLITLTEAVETVTPVLEKPSKKQNH